MKANMRRFVLLVALAAACLTVAAPECGLAWWHDITTGPTSKSDGWASVATCGTTWYAYGKNTSCTNYNKWVAFKPGLDWKGKGYIDTNWQWVVSYRDLGQRLRQYDISGNLTGYYNDVNMCANNSCDWTDLDYGITGNLYNWNGIYIDCNESWDVGCGSPCGTKATSANQVRIYGDKWVYLNDWIVFGGYASSSNADTANRSFPWGEAGLYAYGALDTSHGNVFATSLFSGKVPFRVSTGDCGQGNKLDFKGNASNAGNNNCDNCDAYAFAWVHTPGGAGPQLGVGADDGHRIWLNGTLVSDNNAYTGGWDSYNPGAKGFGGGWNRVLYKVHNGGGGFDGTLSLHHGTDWNQMEPSVSLQGDRYGGFSVGYEQDDWYPRIDVANFYGSSNPQPGGDFFGNNTTVTASGTASVTGPVPFWKVMNHQWGYGISGDTNYTDVTSSGTSWSHSQTGVTGRRRFHFFSVSKSGRTSFQNSGASGGWNWADGGPANYMDVYVDNVAPQNPSFSSVSAGGTTQINLAWAFPLDQGVNCSPGSTEYTGSAAEGGGDNAYRRGDVGVGVYRGGSAIYGWGAATGFNDTGLSPNTQYTYTIAARDNTSQSRGGWANSTGQMGSTAKYTLQNTPATPTFSSVSTGGFTVATTGPVNVTLGYSGVIFCNGTADRTRVQALSEAITGLAANTQYTFKAKGVNGDGIATGYSGTASKYTLIQTPATPTFGTITANSIVLNTSGCSNITTAPSGAYFDSTTTGGDGGINAWVQATTDTATGLSANTQYTFQVKARNGESVETGYSGTASKYTLQTAASTPTFGTVGANSIVLNTTGPVNLTAGSSGVIFKRGSTDLAKVQALTTTDTGLTPNTSYSYTARGVNGDNTATAESSSASKYTLASQPIAGVNVNTATPTGTWIKGGTAITFANPKGFGTSTHGGDAYRVSKYKYAWNNSSSHTFSGSESDWSTGDLVQTPNVTGDYYLHLQSRNAEDAATAATLDYGPFKVDATAPSAGPAVSTTANSSGITINFTAGSDGESGLSATEAYRVTRSAYGDGYSSGALTDTNPVLDAESLTEMAAGDTASYTITTSDGVGNTSQTTITGRRPLASTAWIYTTGASSMAAPGLIPNAGTPATTGVFAGSNDYRLHGMDPGAGGMLFVPVDTGALVQGTVLDRTAPIKDYAAYGLANPMVFASSLDGKVYARKFAASAWSEAWTQQAVSAGYPVKVKPAGQLQVTLTAGPRSGQTRNLVVAGTYANNLDNSFVALDMADGSVLWTTKPGNLAYVTGSPVISGTTAYFTSYSVSGSPSIWKVDLTTGTVIWSRSDAGSISAAPALSGDGTVLYVGNDAGTVYAFSTANGTSPALWSSALADGPVYGAPWPFGGTVFVSTLTKVHKLSAATGALAGSGWPVPVSRPSIPVVGASGKLYVGASGGNIYEIDIATGATKTKPLGAGAGTIGDPVLGTDAPELYVGAADGRIYKIALPFE